MKGQDLSATQYLNMGYALTSHELAVRLLFWQLGLPMDEKPTTNQTHESLFFGDRNDLDEIQESEDTKATNAMPSAVREATFVTELSEAAKFKMEIIQSLLEPCDRTTYGQKLREAAEKLGKTVRTVQRLVKKYQEQGLSAIANTERSDKGEYRIDEDWQKFIIKTFKEGNSGGRKMT